MSSEPSIWVQLVTSCQPDELHNLNGRLRTIIDNKNHANFSVFKINLIKDSIGYYIFIGGLVIAECKRHTIYFKRMEGLGRDWVSLLDS